MKVKFDELEIEVRDEKDLELLKEFFEFVMRLRSGKTLKEPSGDESAPVKSDNAGDAYDESSDDEPEGFIDAGHFSYKVDKNEGTLRIKTKYMSRVFSYDDVRKLYDLLPEEATVEDVIRVASELGLKIPRPIAYMLMHVFARYVDFDATIVRTNGEKGRKMKLVKNGGSANDVVKDTLEIERNVIGTPWGPGDFT